MTPTTENKCGTCNLCCKIPSVAVLKKPAQKWCQHCEIGKGCKIYDERPETCSKFKCYWLLAQEQPNPMPLKYRPDKTKVIISPTTSSNTVAVMCDKGYKDAWDKPPMIDILEQILAQGYNICVGWDEGEDKILLNYIGPGVIGRTPIKMTPPDENGMQWYHGPKGHLLTE